MLKDLKFVQGAVAKKTFVPELTHFRIENGEIRSFNGTLALSSPIDLDIDCTPKAQPFIKAIQNCKETVSMHLTPTSRLSVKSGAFKAFIECIEEETPHVMPEGNHYEIDGDMFLKALKTVTPFIGDDASRPWSNGVLLSGGSALATNNISVIEYWVGEGAFPVRCNVPREAVREIVRINEPPIKVQMDDKSITFYYNNGRWVRTALLNSEWPDISRILDVKCNPSPIDNRLYEALDSISPFVDKLGRIYIKDGVISTSLIDGEGASYEMPDFPYEGVYQLKFLSRLKGIATTMDFSLYPKPCIFYGDRLRGALVGMRS